MEWLTAVCTDKGIKKETNQDAMLLKSADTDFGKILLAVMCDGMGGLAKGEVASSALVREMDLWFDSRLPGILMQGLTAELLRREWDELVANINRRIADYGFLNGLSLGTTLSALLLVGDTYFIINIGDSRVYMIKNQVLCLTKDQTYVQREIDLGHMTYEEAMESPERNVLLQCVGASSVIIPDYYTGSFQSDTMFMLCSDGFRHLISPEEMYEHLNPYDVRDEELMEKQARYLIDLNKYRQETDNISVMLIRIS